jgi:MinD-like ATPase involved in chromosome partitioning or flagellar assembly
MLVSLVSAKGAPGVTAAALALTAAAQAQRPALMVEADPGGGVLECWCGPLGEPGLLEVATRLRSGADADVLWDHAAIIGPEVPVIVGPTTAAPMSAALAAVDATLGTALAGLDATVVVDTGRWIGNAATAALLKASSGVVAVCRPTLDSIEHTRGLVASLASVTAFPSVLVVGGAKPYGPAEIESALRLPVVGVLPWDQRGLNALLEPRRQRAWAGSPLARAASDVVRVLVGEPAPEAERV